MNLGNGTFLTKLRDSITIFLSNNFAKKNNLIILYIFLHPWMYERDKSQTIIFIKQTNIVNQTEKMAKKHLKIILSYQHLLISEKWLKSNIKRQKLDFNPFLPFF